MCVHFRERVGFFILFDCEIIKNKHGKVMWKWNHNLTVCYVTFYKNGCTKQTWATGILLLMIVLLIIDNDCLHVVKHVSNFVSFGDVLRSIDTFIIEVCILWTRHYSYEKELVNFCLYFYKNSSYFNHLPYSKKINGTVLRTVCGYFLTKNNLTD